MSVTVSDLEIVKFNVNGISQVLFRHQALEYVQELANATRRTSWVFTDVVAGRAVIVQSPQGVMRPYLSMKTEPKLTFDQFCSFLQRPYGISPERWDDLGFSDRNKPFVLHSSL